MKPGERWKGTVKWYNEARGRGFITADNGYDIHVHHTGIAGKGVKFLDEHQRVSFLVGETDERLTALEVTPLKED